MADCEEAWGFFPCSTNVGGNLVLMFGYGYVLLQGATWIGDGCEELLGFIGPGILGGLVLPVLGALPDAMMVLMSGMFTSPEKAQSQVAVGMGTLVGSTVMLLSIALGGSTWLGRCDLNADGVAIDKRLTDTSFSFSKLFFDKTTGITTEDDTPFNCKIMLLSSIAFLVVEVPALAGYTKDPTASLVGAILCFVLLFAYCAFQDEGSDDDDDESDLVVPVSPGVRARNGLLQVLLGVLTVSIFSEPMVDAVDGFSNSMGLPTFYVSFILTPFASNASELVSSLKFAAKKKKKNISLTYSQIWGAITMNNTMVLGLFLLIVYTKNLEWKYTAETASVLLPIWLSAYWGYGSVNIPTSAAGYFLALYPLSLGFCVILESLGID
eukprot:gene6151-7376_t